MSDHETLHQALRVSTSAMMRLDLDKLSAVEALRLDLACALRLELDRSAALQARGEAVDVRALTAAAEALEQLLRPAEEPQRGAERTAARERLKQLVEAVITNADCEWASASERESEAAAAFYLEAMAPPAPSAPAPVPSSPPSLRVVRAEPSVPAPVQVAAPTATEREWRDWYYGGAGDYHNTGRRIHWMPEGW